RSFADFFSAPSNSATADSDPPCWPQATDNTQDRSANEREYTQISRGAGLASPNRTGTTFMAPIQRRNGNPTCITHSRLLAFIRRFFQDRHRHITKVVLEFSRHYPV